MALQDIFIVVWIVVHVFKGTETLCFMWISDLWWSSICVGSGILHLLKHNKTYGLTELCVSILFKFEISCHCESFFINLMQIWRCLLRFCFGI